MFKSLYTPRYDPSTTLRHQRPIPSSYRATVARVPPPAPFDIPVLPNAPPRSEQQTNYYKSTSNLDVPTVSSNGLPQPRHATPRSTRDPPRRSKAIPSTPPRRLQPIDRQSESINVDSEKASSSGSSGARQRREPVDDPRPVKVSNIHEYLYAMRDPDPGERLDRRNVRHRSLSTRRKLHEHLQKASTPPSRRETQP